MSSEELVWIDGPKGRIPGVVHIPAQPRHPTVCVVMLNAGLVSRAGPQRLYVNAARQWANLGLTCLRVDLQGAGDNPAENPARHFDAHSPEEAGAVVGYAIEQLHAASVYVQGLCAGARAALRCAVINSRVSGVLAWSCPIISSAPGWPTAPNDGADSISQWGALHVVKVAIRAIIGVRFIRSSWWKDRLESGRDEARQILLAIRQLARGVQKSRNPFLDSVDQLIGGRRDVLFVFGETDEMPLGEFRDRFPTVPQGGLLRQGYYVVPKGTHTFNAIDSQLEVIRLSAEWMLARQ